MLGVATPEVEQLSLATGARIVRAGSEDLDTPLPGYQRTNFAVARAAAREQLGVLDRVVVERVAARITVPGRRPARRPARRGAGRSGPGA